MRLTKLIHSSFTQLCSRLESSINIFMWSEGSNLRFNSQTAQFSHRILIALLPLILFI